MALLMEPGSEPRTQDEINDLEAIHALKHSAALELKEQGNQYVKMGKKHYSDAIDCYTRAISQNVLSDSENSVLYSNRSLVNLLLGNYRRALTDAEEALKLCPTNVKAKYRAAKASLSLNLLAEAASHSEDGLKLDPNNDELKKLSNQIRSLKIEKDKREAELSKAVSEAKDLLKAMEHRGLKFGRATFGELTTSRKPILDRNGILHWPVLLLYPETMSSDLIEDFCETDMFSSHMDEIFSDSSPPLPWDSEKKYTRDAIELHYEAGTTSCLPKKQILDYLLQGTVAANVGIIDNETDMSENSKHSLRVGSEGSPKWVKINEKSKLHDVLKAPEFVIPGIPASMTSLLPVIGIFHMFNKIDELEGPPRMMLQERRDEQLSTLLAKYNQQFPEVP